VFKETANVYGMFSVYPVTGGMAKSHPNCYTFLILYYIYGKKCFRFCPNNIALDHLVDKANKSATQNPSQFLSRMLNDSGSF